MSEAAEISPDEYFRDKHEFADDVLGAVYLNQLERDCVDTPEFQRLFRLSQLGLVDLVYHTANHTRGIHSIGACATAKNLTDWLNKNTPKITQARSKARLATPSLPTVTRSERCLISLAGLLHDIPHAPFSHDIERKTHWYGDRRIHSFYGPYDKHDDFEANPALYVALFDIEKSVLARVLQHHSKTFWSLLKADADTQGGEHLRDFVRAVQDSTWATHSREILAALLFHLLAFEKLRACQ